MYVYCIVDCIYNHGELSRADAEALLSSLDYNCFLVRQSSNAVGCLVYSYKDYGHFNHVKKEETIDLDFVHSTQESACLMPIHLKGKFLEPTSCHFIYLFTFKNSRQSSDSS